MLEHAVEVVHDADEIAVREHARVTRRAGDAQAAVGRPGTGW
jgi:hypothetical protein